MIQFILTLQRLVRGIAAAWKRDPQFRSSAVLVVFTLLSGTLFYRAVEGWSTVDAFYFSVTTLTTVGLGDIAPSTTSYHPVRVSKQSAAQTRGVAWTRERIHPSMTSSAA